MKSGIVLIFIWIINLFFINPCKSEEIYGKAELSIKRGDLIFKIIVFNNSENDIYIPLTYWYFNGDTASCLSVSFYQSFFMNKIEFLNSKYEDFESWVDGGYDNSFLTKVPSFRVVHPKDSSLIRVKVIVPMELLSKFVFDTFNFHITLAYGDDESLSEIGRIIDCQLLQLEEDDEEEECQLILIEYGKKQIEWYKFNEFVDCELDSLKSKIFSIGFLKKLTFKTRLTLPSINLK